MRSTIAHPSTTPFVADKSLLAAVLTAAVPFTSGENQDSVNNTTSDESTSSSHAQDSSTPVETIAEVATTPAAQSEGSAPVVTDLEAPADLAQDLGIDWTSFSELQCKYAAFFEAIYRTVSNMNTSHRREGDSVENTVNTLRDEVEEIEQTPVDSEWLSKARDADIESLVMKGVSTAENENTQEEGAEAVAGPLGEVETGFREYVQALGEKYSAHFAKFKQMREEAAKLSVENLPVEEQVNQLADQIASSQALAYGAKLVQSMADQYGMISSIVRRRRGDAEEGVAEEEESQSSPSAADN